MSTKPSKDSQFTYVPISEDDLDVNNRHDFSRLYERAHNELSLQQTKRDQIITLYLSIFSLLIPFALSLQNLTSIHKALIFLAVGIIGIIFTVIVIRYRIYKEVYWLTCETITCLTNLKNEECNKEKIQSLFYYSLKKKGTNFFVNGRWSTRSYVKKNLFSSETLHYLVIALLTSIMIGLSIILFQPFELAWTIVLSCSIGLLLFIILLVLYFHNCKEVYSVLIDGKDSSFNKTFSKAWFLHIYVDFVEEK